MISRYCYGLGVLQNQLNGHTQSPQAPRPWRHLGRRGGRSIDKIPESCAPVNARHQFEAAVLEAEATLQRTIGARLKTLLEAIVCHGPCRPYHRRRSRVSRRMLREGRCSCCGTRASHRFTRSGFRERSLLSRWCSRRQREARFENRPFPASYLWRRGVTIEFIATADGAIWRARLRQWIRTLSPRPCGFRATWACR